ncbi:MAG TPA: triose-phosphate isomerase [Thermoplasmata archaeon]|nr:triose-phosphate isomerase [Thermoplasmata archaeon]
MRLPVIVVNFKVYPEVLGKRGWHLAQQCAQVAEDTGASIVIAPPLSDLAHIARLVHIPVFGQHADTAEAGAHTGWLPPEALLEAGAAGTLLNHSERKIPHRNVAALIPRCERLGLEVIACADDLKEAEALARLGPDYIAVEPPELIGGDVSVTTARPEVVSDAVARIHAVDRGVSVLCGAGVKDRKDVRKALELGTVGVLLASGVVKARRPDKALRDLVSGLK